MSAAAKNHAPEELRRLVAQALANAVGPEEVTLCVNRGGRVYVWRTGIYVWKGCLPGGKQFEFTTPTPALEYAGLIETVAARLFNGRDSGSFSIRHSRECREAGVGCICAPVVRDVTGGAA